MPDPTVKKLSAAVDGLLFISESDAPFEAFDWGARGAPTPKLVRELGGHTKRAPVEESGLQDFLKPLTEEKDWHEDEEKERVRRYRGLLAIFEQELTDATVFRVGDIKVTYYLVGKSRAGNWVGVKAEATET